MGITTILLHQYEANRDFFTWIGLEMHPHPQDGSPGRFQGAGCVADHLGLIGIRTCGSYGKIYTALQYRLMLFFTWIGLEMYPQDGSPGRFQGAGCVADLGIRNVALIGTTILLYQANRD